MGAEAYDPREVFQDSLNRAIAHGLRPSRSIGLGADTFAAIEAVANEHPEATVDHITEAFDAFIREQAGDDDARSGEPVAGDAPKRLVARKDRFTAR